MTEPETPTVPTVEFRGRMMPVQLPDEAQYAILIEAERWMNKVDKERAAVGDVPEDAPADHPGRVKLDGLLKISKGHLGRFLSVLGSLFLDEDDWDYIRDGMADRSINRAEVFELPALIIRACRNSETMQPDNRAAKRKTAKAARTR